MAVEKSGKLGDFFLLFVTTLVLKNCCIARWKSKQFSAITVFFVFHPTGLLSGIIIDQRFGLVSRWKELVCGLRLSFFFTGRRGWMSVVRSGSAVNCSELASCVNSS